MNWDNVSSRRLQLISATAAQKAVLQELFGFLRVLLKAFGNGIAGFFEERVMISWRRAGDQGIEP